MRRQLAERRACVVVSPDDTIVILNKSPPSECLASHQWPKQSGFDLSASIAGVNLHESEIMSLRAYQKGIVAACFNAKVRSPEHAFVERHTSGSESIKRGAGVGWHQQPWAAWTRIERESVGVDIPVSTGIPPLH
jgi:hypothetical protein